MEIITKYQNNKFDSHNFSIFKDTNREQFKELSNIIDQLKEEGTKTNLKLNKKYQNTIYLSVLDKWEKFGTFTPGRKYRLTIKDLEKNKKGYINFTITNSEEIPEPNPVFGYLI